MMFFDGLVGLFTGKIIYATFELVNLGVWLTTWWLCGHATCTVSRQWKWVKKSEVLGGKTSLVFVKCQQFLKDVAFTKMTQMRLQWPLTWISSVVKDVFRSSRGPDPALTGSTPGWRSLSGLVRQNCWLLINCSDQRTHSDWLVSFSESERKNRKGREHIKKPENMIPPTISVTMTEQFEDLIAPFLSSSQWTRSVQLANPFVTVLLIKTIYISIICCCWSHNMSTVF